jgi:hypothetical protein
MPLWALPQGPPPRSLRRSAGGSAAAIGTRSRPASPGFKTYATALRTPYRHWVQPLRRQATGPTLKPRWLPLPELLYAQVVKLSGADVPASVSGGLPKVLCLRRDGPSLAWSQWLLLTGQLPFSVGSRSTTTFLKRLTIPSPRPKRLSGHLEKIMHNIK